ncbi:ribosome biogenesis GTPase YlqF [Selenihalanaerobacter shriftii]|uniref:Ribosome biogenesis GTPase A n=1 Tax=Selenihalanaerobacter shriftii TaxID=142842 RepID=A0A1T4M9R4_9FIRM|nr:ribosome biogenesis GTPase YlqF [Selenihalanaerobacter shriftii]SJZ63641.1 ribosome biogenesis GTPase A [Selenihalanaerobacter shriftii]
MINWYPGHMAKAKKKLQERLQLIDVVVELLDARIPVSSRNPNIDEILQDKKRIIVLNKMDLADKAITKAWKKKLAQEDPAIAVNSLNGQRINLITNHAKNLMADKLNKLVRKGRKKRNIRLMIVGVPNVGKSQLINQLCNRGSTRTGDRPGVTRGQQWVKIKKGFELLDTPGILWPKFESEEVAFRLAATGAIKSDIYDNETVAYKLLKFLKDVIPDTLQERFNLDYVSADTLELMEDIGRKRGCLMSGGKVDRERTADIILYEFRKGDLGRISLEIPSQS